MKPLRWQTKKGSLFWEARARKWRIGRCLFLMHSTQASLQAWGMVATFEALQAT
jgi:hypothetical protein